VLRLTPAVISQLQDNQQYSLIFSATSFLGASTQQNVTFTKVPSGAMPAVGIVGGSSRKLSIVAGGGPATCFGALCVCMWMHLYGRWHAFQQHGCIVVKAILPIILQHVSGACCR
jgi:hypothetical protein